jgi:alanyl-tRNA synthetase
MTPEEAMDKGAMALFGEKYGSEVRVLTMGDFSMELCGGTHVKRTGDIGCFKIISETGIAAGIRRIEAVTGPYAFDYIKMIEDKLQHIASTLNTSTMDIEPRIEQLQKNLKTVEKEIEKLKTKFASSASQDLLSQAESIGDIKILVQTLENADAKTLRETMDMLKTKCDKAVIVLAAIQDNKVNLVTGVTKITSEQVHAGELMQFLAGQIGGKGGGRADMAQGGGTEPSKLPAALSQVKHWINERLGVS